MVFSNLAIQTKRLAPNASTFLEIMRVRYGAFVHISFMFFSLAANTVSHTTRNRVPRSLTRSPCSLSSLPSFLEVPQPSTV